MNKAYIEDGEFQFDHEDSDKWFSYSHKWDMAYLYTTDGDEIDVTPYFPSKPTLEKFEKAAIDYCKGIPYQLHRPDKLKEIIQRETMQTIRAVSMENQRIFH